MPPVVAAVVVMVTVKTGVLAGMSIIGAAVAGVSVCFLAAGVLDV